MSRYIFFLAIILNRREYKNLKICHKNEYDCMQQCIQLGGIFPPNDFVHLPWKRKKSPFNNEKKNQAHLERIHRCRTTYDQFGEPHHDESEKFPWFPGEKMKMFILIHKVLWLPWRQRKIYAVFISPPCHAIKTLWPTGDKWGLQLFTHGSKLNCGNQQNPHRNSFIFMRIFISFKPAQFPRVEFNENWTLTATTGHLAKK
jgi:hypothetical protein